MNITYDLKSEGLTETHFVDNTTYEDMIYDLMILPLHFANKEVTLADIKRGYTGIDYILVPYFDETWTTMDRYDNPVYVATMQEIFSTIADVRIQARTNQNTSPAPSSP